MDSDGLEERARDSQELVVGIDKKIPFVEKLLFPAATGMASIINLLIQLYLYFYYTNILQMSIVYFGAVFLVVQIIAAAIAPVYGAFIDRHTTRWGKYKPWIFIILTGTALGAVLTFLPVNFGATGNLVYATIAYAVFSMFMSMNLAPRIGMIAAMTKRQDDRMTLAVSSFVWVTVGSVVVSYTALPLVTLLGNGNQGRGFPYLMLLCMIITAVFALVITKVVKERFVISVEKQAEFSFKLLAQTLSKNKYALIAIAGSFILSLYTGFKTAMVARYCLYYFRDSGMLPLMIALSMYPVIIGVFLSPIFTKKLGVKNNILVMVIVNVITSVATFFIPATAAGVIALSILSATGFLFIGIARPAQETMLPFAADYGEWKFNTNCAGFLGTLNGFMQTLYTVIIGVLPAWVFVLIGYVPNSEQSAASLVGIRLSMSIIPALLFVILGLIIARWDMTRERQIEIINEMRARQAYDCEA